MELIALAFDGSMPSFVALDWVAERAARGGAEVMIAMVSASILSDDFRVDDAIVKAEKRLRDRVPDIHLTSQRFSGRMPEALLAHTSAADLLVLGSRRGRPVRSALSGWMPLRVASRSRIPAVVVPDDWTPSDGPVVVGLDDDDSSSAAIDLAADEAGAAGGSLAVVHAWQMPTPQMDGSIALLASPIQVKAEHRRILRDGALAAVTTHPGLVVEQTLVQENPAAALLHRAEGASLLVIGTHHRGLFAGALLGSVGQDVLWQAALPVCVAPNDVAVAASSPAIAD